MTQSVLKVLTTLIIFLCHLMWVAIAPPLTLSSALTTNPNLDSHGINSYKVDWQMVTDHTAMIDNYCIYIREHMPVLSDSVVSCCDPSCSKHWFSLFWVAGLTGCQCQQVSSKILLQFLGGTYRHTGFALLGNQQTFWHKVWCDDLLTRDQLLWHQLPRDQFL